MTISVSSPDPKAAFLFHSEAVFILFIFMHLDCPENKSVQTESSNKRYLNEKRTARFLP